MYSHVSSFFYVLPQHFIRCTCICFIPCKLNFWLPINCISYPMLNRRKPSKTCLLTAFTSLLYHEVVSVSGWLCLVQVSPIQMEPAEHRVLIEIEIDGHTVWVLYTGIHTGGGVGDAALSFSASRLGVVHATEAGHARWATPMDFVSEYILCWVIA